MSAIASAQRLTAPDFVLSDHLEGQVRLSDHWAHGPVLLTFFRGHWCPYCRRYLAKLQANADRFARAGVQPLAVSPEPPMTSRSLARELGLTFPVLADTDGLVIDDYGTRNGFLHTKSLIPHPAVFLIDREGAIRFRSIDRNFKKRTTVRSIFAAIDEL